VGALLLCVAAVPAAAEDSLVELEPYDELVLTAEFDNAVLKVVPLELPGRRLPQKRAGAVRIRLFARPNRQYDVQWSSISEARLFEDLVLDQAKDWVGQGKFGAAYQNYAWLLERDPEYPGLTEALEAYLFTDASAAFRSGDLDTSLARLLEVYARNPQRPGLSVALSRVAESRLEGWVRDGRFRPARAMIRQLKQTLAPTEQATVLKWEKLLAGQGAKLFAAAQEQFQAKDYRQARQLVNRAVITWPQTPGARELAAAINERFSQVVVGVHALQPAQPGDSLADAPSRRTGPLTHRTLMELTGYGPEGGQYRCPLGDYSEDDTGQELTITLRQGIPWSVGPGEITGIDISRTLLDAADPLRVGYRPEWAQALDGVSVERVFRVHAFLRRPHFRPQALLTIPVQSAVDADGQRQAFGPYVLADQTESETRYRASENYASANPDQLKELVEHGYADADAAIAALVGGEVSVLARAAPWSVPQLKAHDELVVDRFAFPRVHALIPNRSRGPLASRTFRRALVYGIAREVILRQELLAGPDSKVLSGPFLVGTSFEDPIGYASDEQITPRPYDPRLAMTLASVAMKELATKQRPAAAEEEQAALPLPTLVLVHASNPIAVAACEAIERHLERAGFSIERKLWREGLQYDLRYVELAMWEPVVDAPRLLGEHSLTGGPSPYMTLALARLAKARDSKQVRSRLQEIHRLVHDELSIIPLWQLVDHFAYHRSVAGIGQRPAGLYQNVEAWRTELRLETEE
jgi:tetratricopeptide (TPR) repeat protein